MMEASQLVAVCSVLVAFVALLVGIFRDASNSQKDSAGETSEILQKLTEIKTTQDFQTNDMKDVKADVRSFRGELTEVKAIADKALAEGRAANTRLDYIDAPSAYKVRGDND